MLNRISNDVWIHLSNIESQVAKKVIILFLIKTKLSNAYYFVLPIIIYKIYNLAFLDYISDYISIIKKLKNTEHTKDQNHPDTITEWLWCLMCRCVCHICLKLECLSIIHWVSIKGFIIRICHNLFNQLLESFYSLGPLTMLYVHFPVLSPIRSNII